MDALEFLRERKRMCNLHKDYTAARLQKVTVSLAPSRLMKIVRELSLTHRDEDGRCAIMMQSKCYDCRREFWMQEVE